MKRLATLAATTLFVLATAPAAMARAESYYTIVCDGISYESVDGHAIEQGGKLAAVLHFGEKHDMDCGVGDRFED